MLSKIIRLLYYSLFFAVPLIMFHKTSELFEFNKIVFIYTIASLVAFLGALNYILTGYNPIRKNILNRFFLIFFLVLIVATIFSIDYHTSLFGYYGRFNGGLFSIAAYITLYFGFISYFQESKDRERLLKVSVVSSLIVILWAIPGKFGYDLSCQLFIGQLNNSCWSDQFRPQDRIFSTLGQPNWLGAYLVIHFFIGIYFYLKNLISAKNIRLNKANVILMMYLVLNFTSILFTRSRSSLLALTLGFLLAAFLLWKSGLLKKVRPILLSKFFFIPLVLCLVAVVIFKTGVHKIDSFLSLQSSNNVSNPSEQIQLSSEVTESLDIRKIVWKGAWELGLRYPLFGTGPETFAYSYYFTRPIEHNMTSEWDFIYNKAHNEYLNYLATTGFVGLGAYLLMIGVVIFNFHFFIFNKNSKSLDQILFISLFCAYLSILVTNFFGFSTTTINLFFYSIPGFLIASILTKKEPSTENKQLGLRQYLGIIIACGILLYTLFFLVNYVRGDIKYAEADSYSQIGEYQQSFRTYDEAIKIHKEHVYIDKFSYTLANLAFLASYDNDKGTSNTLISLSKYYNQQSLLDAPKNVLYWKTRAKNYYLFYQITSDKKDLESAITALEVAESLSPTDPKIFYTKAVIYSAMEDEEKAMREVDRSINMKKDFRDGYMLKAQLFKKYGDPEKATKVLKYILEKINPNDTEAKDELNNL